MSLKEMNKRLECQPFLSGYAPSNEDALAIKEMFGGENVALQWCARMASYYPSELTSILNVKKSNDEDEDFDMFADETEEEKAALEEKKKREQEIKKPKKTVIAKSTILIDIKPWDDTTDLDELAVLIKKVERDGLLWGAQKLVPIAFGLKKLQQMLVIEDEKVASADIEDIITSFEDHVQSMDIVSWNKI